MRVILISFLLSLVTSLSAASDMPVERWAVFELELEGPKEGNPFVDVLLSAEFTNGARRTSVSGFYDGDGHYKVRMMPDEIGPWTWVTRSSAPSLDGRRGEFQCVAPSPGNRGPVRVRNTFHFAYADGTPYWQIGTTCYAWTHQGDAMEEQTLKTLAASPFNKMRMCVFPKHYVYNANEPVYYPFARDAAGQSDFRSFDPAFWHHFEKRILDLQKMGIEADIILFHPYDRWGYAKMDRETDIFYLKYTIARLAAFRNVWWSLANEFDFMQSKLMNDWDAIFETIVESDPYGRMRGIHNGSKWYDHTRPWVTHCSIQSSDFTQLREWRERYQKPLVFDECRYEGDIKEGWGNLKPEQLVEYFWRGTVGGAYVGHGETYKHPEDLLWWAKGGTLRGESLDRIAFLKGVLETAPDEGIDYLAPGVGGKKGEYYLCYFGKETPRELELDLPPLIRFKAEILDTWNMTVEEVPGEFFGSVRLPLPERPYLAVRAARSRFDFPAEPLVVDPTSKHFIRGLRVRLGHPQHKSIFYTLDGSEPTEQSSRYQEPITINRDGTTLRAFSVGPDGERSEQIVRTYRTAAARPPLEVKDFAPGLAYKLYNGAWESLPDFAALEPVASGTAPSLTLAVRNRDDEIGIVFEGLIHIPEEEVYTFTVTSDDGTLLWIDDELVVDNDGRHAPTAVSGEIGLAEGYHKIRLHFFEADGGEELDVKWSSPKFSSETIPEQLLGTRR
jgi:hypothetical protein